MPQTYKEKIKKPSKSERELARHRVRRSIHEMVLSGQKAPGSKLAQLDLAKQFDVAQGVVREALLELQLCGLVETKDNRGMYVSELNEEKILESFEVREVLEGLAARLCCERVTRAQIRELIELSEECFARYAEKHDLDDMARLDRELHHRIVTLSGNSMLVRLAENYRALGKIIRAERDPQEVLAEHKALLKAIEDGQSDTAERLMRQHIRNAKEKIKKEMEKDEFSPKWLASAKNNPKNNSNNPIK